MRKIFLSFICFCFILSSLFSLAFCGKKNNKDSQPSTESVFDESSNSEESSSESKNDIENSTSEKTESQENSEKPSDGFLEEF